MYRPTKVVEVADVATVGQANELLKKGWELYKIHSHQDKHSIILVKRA